MGNFFYSAEGDTNGCGAHLEISFSLNDAAKFTHITCFLLRRKTLSRA